MWTELFNNRELFQSVNRTVSMWPTKPGAGHSWHSCPLASLWSFLSPNHMFLEITFRQSIWTTSIPWNWSLIIESCFHSSSDPHFYLPPLRTFHKNEHQTQECFVFLVCPPPLPVTLCFNLYILENIMGWQRQLSQTIKWPKNWKDLRMVLRIWLPADVHHRSVVVLFGNASLGLTWNTVLERRLDLSLSSLTWKWVNKIHLTKFL